MSGLLDQAARAAERRAATRRAQLVEALAERLPGARVRVVGETVVVRGRALAERWAADPALRVLMSLLP
jgi:hypothetical protein